MSQPNVLDMPEWKDSTVRLISDQERRQARLEAGLTGTDPVSATQPVPTVEHQHREGPSFWQAVKTMFK
jgi:hypothetical protein